MGIIGDWQEKHPRKSGKARTLFYILLLLFVIFLIFKADTFVGGFSRIFFPADSSSFENGSE